jgi:four helix bundle protein
VYHLSVARGSVSELETQLELALRLGMLDRRHSEALTELSQQTGQMLNALIRALDR